jgi:sodium-dependent dicarboxylate transporter 2/3/5
MFITVGALLSGWITDMAVAAMLMPIAVTILKDAKAEPLKSNFGRALLIACAWGPLVGGVSTPAGCGPNPLTMTFLKDLAGINFSFVDWMLIGIPAAILMIPCAWAILIFMFPLEKGINLSIAEDDFKKKLDELGPLQFNEVATLIIFALTVTLWIFGKWIGQWTGGTIDYLGIKFVAIACACLFFVPGISVISWKKAEQGVSWGGIILIVTGLSIGMSIYKTGAAAWMAQVCFSEIGVLHPILIIFAVVFGVSIMKVMFSSNTVTGIIMVPLLIALANNIGLDPVLLAIPAGITSSLAFILVTSTPTNVIPYSAGYFTIRDMVKAGIVMTVASSACVTISIAIMGKLTGIVNY